MWRFYCVVPLLAVLFGCSSKGATSADKFIESVGAEVCTMLSKSECRVCRGNTEQGNDFVDLPAEAALEFRVGSMEQCCVTLMLYKGGTALTPARYDDVKQTYDQLISVMLKAVKERRPDLPEKSVIEAQKWSFHYSTGEVGSRALRLFGSIEGIESKNSDDRSQAVLMTTEDGRWDILIVVPGEFRSGLDPLKIAHRIAGRSSNRR